MKMRTLALALFLFAMSTPALAQVDLSRPLPVDEHTICLLRMDELGRGQVQEAVSGRLFPAAGAVGSLGRFGGALSLRGVDGWIDLPNRPESPPADGMTVECWVKFRSRASGDIICRNGGYMMRLGGSVSAMFHVDGGWRTLAGSASVPVGRWTHLAMTYDRATREIRIYVDGELDTAGVPRGLTATIADPAAPGFAAEERRAAVDTGLLDAGASVLRIGGNTWSVAGSVPDALMDEIRVSSVARAYTPLRVVEDAPLPENTNLVGNPSFESGIYGWRIWPEGNGHLRWGVESGQAAHGQSFLRAREPAARTIVSYPFPIVRGRTHTVSASMRADTPCDALLRLRLTGRGSGGARSRRSSPMRIGGEWQRVWATFDIPEDWPTATAYVEVGTRANAIVDLDAVSVVVGDRTDYMQTEAESIGLNAHLPPQRTYLLGGDSALPVTLANNGEAARSLTLACSVTDWLGREVTRQQVPVGAVPAGQAAQVRVALPEGQVGWFVARFEVLADGRVVKREERLFNVIESMQGVGDAADSPLGMNTHMEREATPHLEYNMRMLSLCGVKWVRAWWGWGMAEKQPGQFDWTEYDRQLETVRGAGMEIMPILLRYYPEYEQEWAGETRRIQLRPHDLNQWASFVRTTAERYRGRVKAWEVWNEPTYTMDADYYAQLLKATWDSIRAVDPDVTVVGFGGSSPAYVRGALQAGAAGSFDVIADHSYSQLTQPFHRMANLAAEFTAVTARFNVPNRIWHTEQGTQSDGAGYRVSEQTEEQCAVNVIQGYLSALSTGVEKFFWFSAQTTAGYGWGVFYENYVPRPRLVAINGLARLLNGRHATGRMELADGRIACVLLDGEAGAAAALWNLSEIMSVRLPQGTQATWTDMLGNPTEPDADGRVQLRMGRPLYVLADGAGVDRLVQALQGAEAIPCEPLEATVTRAADGSLAVVLRNVSVEHTDARLAVHAPALFAEAPAPVAVVDLAPGAAYTATFRLDTAPAAGTDVPVTVRLEIGGHGIRTVTVQPAVRY